MLVLADILQLGSQKPHNFMEMLINTYMSTSEAVSNILIIEKKVVLMFSILTKI